MGETQKSGLLFSDCFAEYLRSAFPLLKKSTQQAYFIRFRYFTTGPLPHVKMDSFNAENVHEWINWLKQQPTARKNRRYTFAGELKILKVILNWYKNFVDTSFDVPVTKQHWQVCCYKFVPPKRPDYYARPEELRAWVQWLKQHRKNPVYWRLAGFMVLTGARVGEACGMLWKAIDFELGTAQVVRRIRWDQTTKRPYLEDITKTPTSNRLLILSDELIDMLKQMCKENGSDGLIFTDKKKGALKYSAVQSSFNAGFTALDLPWRSTHILRHSYATTALMATKDLPSIQASLGHVSIRTTERYAKAVALLNRETAQKTAKAFNLFSNN